MSFIQDGSSSKSLLLLVGRNEIAKMDIPRMGSQSYLSIASNSLIKENDDNRNSDDKICLE